MRSEELGQSIKFHLLNVAYLRFERYSEYFNIISPFSRLYLIAGGSGSVVIRNERILLEPGNLYLIPSFTPCSYFFEKDLEHYYIHLSTETGSVLSGSQLYTAERKVPMQQGDTSLFNRLITLNPDLQLPHHDPKVYQTKEWMNKKVNYRSVGHYLETQGILQQLFSRFLQNESGGGKIISSRGISLAMKYIEENLSGELRLGEMSRLACCSKDHFTRQFRSVTGMPPSEFIIRKRIEKAQLFLLTTDYPLSRIIELTGIKTTAYFCRLFRKFTGFTPESYRRQRA